MTTERVSTWIGIITAIALGGIAWGANDQKIKALEDKVEKQEELKERSIRIEERQIRLQEDVKKILDKLENE